MSARETVVVTDVASPQRFIACLSAVVRSVGEETNVVVISRSQTRLPRSIERRVRRVRLAQGQDVELAVEREAVRPALVIVLPSTTNVCGDWFAQLSAAAARTPHCVGIVGDGEDKVLVFGEHVLSTRAQDIQLPMIAGISWPSSRLRSGSERVARPARVRAVADAESASATASVCAALIVKDEQDVLAQCLSALLPEVDEVVVYDTGSTDDTVRIARQCGARVIEGYWDDDFAAARNRLLEHCTTDWVLSVDADEVLEAQPNALRNRLASERDDLLLVPVISTTWSAAQDGDEHRPARIFRRLAAGWIGALHETLASVSPRPLVLAHEPAPVRLLHSGYHADRMHAKDKSSRNLSIALTEVESIGAATSEQDAARAWANYGRALTSAGRPAEALNAFDTLLELSGNPSEMVQAGRAALSVSLSLKRFTNYERWLSVLASSGESPGGLHQWRARLLQQHGDPEGALGELDAALVAAGMDLWGLPFDPDDSVPTRAAIHSSQGELAQALDVLLDLLRRRPEAVPFLQLLSTTRLAGASLGELAVVGGPAFVARSLRDAVRLEPALANEWLEAVWEATGDAKVLVAGAVIAPNLAMDQILRWAVRVRQAGQPSLCPLTALADDPERPVVQRCLALAVLGDTGLDPSALQRFDELGGGLSDEDVAMLLPALRTYAPGLQVEPTNSVGV